MDTRPYTLRRLTDAELAELARRVSRSTQRDKRLKLIELEVRRRVNERIRQNARQAN